MSNVNKFTKIVLNSQMFQNVPRQQCSTTYERECDTVYTEVCTQGYFGQQQCSQQPQEQCRQAYY